MFSTRNAWLGICLVLGLFLASLWKPVSYVFASRFSVVGTIMMLLGVWVLFCAVSFCGMVLESAILRFFAVVLDAKVLRAECARILSLAIFTNTLTLLLLGYLNMTSAADSIIVPPVDTLVLILVNPFLLASVVLLVMVFSRSMLLWKAMVLGAVHYCVVTVPAVALISGIRMLLF